MSADSHALSPDRSGDTKGGTCPSVEEALEAISSLSVKQLDGSFASACAAGHAIANIRRGLEAIKREELPTAAAHFTLARNDLNDAIRAL